MKMLKSSIQYLILCYFVHYVVVVVALNERVNVLNTLTQTIQMQYKQQSFILR
jgi:hypothetical protein